VDHRLTRLGDAVRDLAEDPRVLERVGLGKAGTLGQVLEARISRVVPGEQRALVLALIADEGGRMLARADAGALLGPELAAALPAAAAGGALSLVPVAGDRP